MGLLLAAVSPVSLVNPFIGTSGTQQGGPIDTFPGADVPFGMLQWSPDTPSQNAGGGYEYHDTAITGFSLTHLSGPGCNVFGDIAFLPKIAPVADPQTAKVAFSHADEHASPGWYDVTLANGVRVQLTVTQRTGLASFTFPAAARATIVVNAGSDQAGVLDAHARVENGELVGDATSGGFCGMPDRFTVYFVARFDHPIATATPWRYGEQLGFDVSRDPTVIAKVAISYVSVDGARKNLAAENAGWNLDAVHAAAVRAWSGALGRIAISGGTPAEQTTFYTALYHAMLHPNVYSDVDGRYRGFDGKVHAVRRGHIEYANYSDWDVYRSQIPLVALLDPARASDMMQSLVDAARQGGFLPRWALVNAPTSVMGGDSVDAVLAGGYAFGARNFDVRGAVDAMVRGATKTAPREDGWYVERPELAEYLRHGYIVNTHTTSVAPVPNGASETLEYALDDFSIAQLARAAGERQTYRTFLRRSSSWANLFDTATGLVAPRDADGAFMDTPITDAGQSGFQEGNAAQYTWMVPQDLRDLIAGMGGDAQARQRLDTFFTQLDAGQNLPYAWLGNEPSLDSPWTYLSVGAPWRAQAVVRQALLTLYNNSPVGLPGNDDLGEMSAWYVWCAIGLYPQNPAMRYLDVGSPLFARVVVNAPGGPTIDIDASGAADGAPYVQSLAVNGVPTEKTWLALPMHGNVHLAFTLGTAANRAWGIAPADAPPSSAFAPVHFPPSSAVTMALAGNPLVLTLTNHGSTPEHVDWRVPVSSRLKLWALGPAVYAGSDPVPAHGTTVLPLHWVPDPKHAPDFVTVQVDGNAENGAVLEPATETLRVGDPHARVPLAFLENIYDNSVTPIDLATGALLAKIPVGASPRDGTFADDGLLYITNRDGATITVIDPLTASVVKTIKVGQGPSGITAAPDGTLWFVNAYDGTVQTIDPKTQIASAPIPVGGAGATLRSLAIVGSTAYVTVTSENEVVPIDLRTRALGAPIAVGGEPEGIVASPNGTRLYVVNRGTDDVTPIDVATQRALAPIRVGVAPVNMTVVPNGTTAYVANYGTDTVTPIDLSRGEAEAPIRVGGEPYAIFVSPDGATLWVVNHEDNDLVPIDLATKSVGTPIIDPYGPLTIVLPR